MGWSPYGRWAPYVPVARRRAQAAAAMERLRKNGGKVQPVRLTGRKIANTFWGEAWCDHLEGFSDYENRLPRGRTYVRNGSVCHLAIEKGVIEAKVSGSSLYSVKIVIKTLPPAKWKALKSSCAGEVGSMIELLQGKLSDRVMSIVTDRGKGLFPSPNEIQLSCSCPDWAVMCKHVAAVLYGVGARLDEKPELLFALRGVDHEELVSKDAAKRVVAKGARSKARTLDDSSLGDVFGIDLTPESAAKSSRRATKRTAKPAPKKEVVSPATPEQSTKAKRSRAGKAGEGRATRRSAGKPSARKPSARRSRSAKTG